VESKPFTIDVRVTSLDGLYSDLDPSPFRQRDLDPRTVEHVVQGAGDAPPRAPLVLRVVVDDHGPRVSAADTQLAVGSFFAHETDLLKRRHRRNKGRMLRWLAVGLGLMTTLLVVRSLLGRAFSDSVLTEVVGEAFVIAGRVALWVPIERLGFDGWLLREQLQLFRRLAQVRVEVVMADTTTAGAER